jgi:hypothetical protein
MKFIHDFLSTGPQFRSSSHCFLQALQSGARFYSSGEEHRMFFCGCILNPSTEITDLSREQL